MTVFLLIYLSLEVTIGGTISTPSYPHAQLDVGSHSSEVIFPHVIKTRSDANDDLSLLSDWRYISPGFFAGMNHAHYIANNGSPSRTAAFM
jgi:hypothetical protein